MDEIFLNAWAKLLDKIANWFNLLILSLPNFLVALIVFIVGYWLSGQVYNLTNRSLRKVVRQQSVRHLLANISSVLTIGVGLMIALAVLNLDNALTSLIAGAGVAGLAVSLALQGTLSNTFSGIFLAIRNELNVGDWVETNGYSGTVVEISLRNTKIREADNNIVVIPNKMILENPFKNFGLTRDIRATITCGVGYESDLEKVRTLATQAIASVFPPPPGKEIEFFYTEFGDSSINFMLRFWVEGKENLTALEVKSKAIMTIKKVFDENDINIPFPIRTLIHKNLQVAQPTQAAEVDAKEN